MPKGPGQLEQTYRFSVMICYEDAIPAIARRFTLDEHGKKRLDWLVNISNDGWFVRFKDGEVFASTELTQHAAICVFRAVENRLAVLRSVNTGISCLIDSTGRIKNGFWAGSLPHEAMERTACAGWLMDIVPIDTRTTFFSKHGGWLDFCCAVCLFLLIITAIVDARARSKKRQR
jgi:apolipoprotein N-acyltransferase